jgi:hypothetical protein
MALSTVHSTKRCGCFKVFRCRRACPYTTFSVQTGQVVAVKNIKLRRESLAAIKREVELSLRLKHQSIVKTNAVYRCVYAQVYNVPTPLLAEAI